MPLYKAINSLAVLSSLNTQNRYIACAEFNDRAANTNSNAMLLLSHSHPPSILHRAFYLRASQPIYIALAVLNPVCVHGTKAIHRLNSSFSELPTLSLSTHGIGPPPPPSFQSLQPNYKSTALSQSRQVQSYIRKLEHEHRVCAQQMGINTGTPNEDLKSKGAAENVHAGLPSIFPTSIPRPKIENSQSVSTTTI